MIESDVNIDTQPQNTDTQPQQMIKIPYLNFKVKETSSPQTI